MVDAGHEEMHGMAFQAALFDPEPQSALQRMLAYHQYCIQSEAFQYSGNNIENEILTKAAEVLIAADSFGEQQSELIVKLLDKRISERYDGHLDDAVVELLEYFGKDAKLLAYRLDVAENRFDRDMRHIVDVYRERKKEVISWMKDRTEKHRERLDLYLATGEGLDYDSEFIHDLYEIADRSDELRSAMASEVVSP